VNIALGVFSFFAMAYGMRFPDQAGHSLLAASLGALALTVPPLDAPRWRVTLSLSLACLIAAFAAVFLRSALVPLVAFLAIASWFLQDAILYEIEKRGIDGTSGIDSQLASGRGTLEEARHKMFEAENGFRVLTRRFEAVRAFGSSLRFDEVWKDIVNGSRALLDTAPLLYIPPLEGGLPSGIHPADAASSGGRAAAPEWQKALSGERCAGRDATGRELLWIPLRLGNGKRAVLHLSVAPDAHDPDAVEILTTQVGLLLEKMRLYHEVEVHSRTDLLTGLLHHASFKALLNEEIARAEATDRPLSLVMCDVDHFKAVNDTYGHLVGDQVLVQIAHRLRDTLRISDTVSRYGGEEFAMLLPATAAPGAREISERIRGLIEAMPMIVKTEAAEQTLKKTISMGCATFPTDAADAATLVEAADAALYRAKRGGRNRVETA
jgi:diguanylate cyclase (GGDEF)-like protein